VKPDQLFDKKLHPFEVSVRTPDSHTMIVTLSGCPVKNPVKVVFERAGQYLAAASQLSQLFIEVPAEMAYEFRSIQYLEEIASIIMRNSKVREDVFIFTGPFFPLSDPQTTVAFSKRYKIQAS
ncbi:MAG: hypothetical protein K8S54_13575, partial [Spirochaetia bacterium]|nr:hypothetical protein [Spirochaetia bacterium]